ncbi:cell envelope integrity protein TolA [Legionella spiritensis]|uniref:cell envelope integrity protein TolA n=1 Tax=Legionella spiritensis TaxID=452 RepID=UPI000F6DBE88|nr:cell envelope integrity protein TolA [Legionella spiritensis]VEG89986.1 TolA colicin import membrane protein [Legionella spiritensis]
MIIDPSYRKSFYAACALHILLAFLLLFEWTGKRPVLVNEAKNEPGEMIAVEPKKQPEKEIVKAVSVDSQEVKETVHRLQQERIRQRKAEQARQQTLARQAEQARQARKMEQQRLEKLKNEAEQLAIARKKQIEQEKKRLRQLALQKEQEAKRLQELQKKQEALKKKQREDERIAIQKKKLAEEKEKAERAAEAARKQAQAASAAAEKARIAGEVDKYKAMIVNAIGRQWILPENADSRLSSQFRIRLAPDGAVLEVSLIRGSGDPVLDRSAQSAIYKASPLPVPSDPATFDLFREISLTVRPENVRG